MSVDAARPRPRVVLALGPPLLALAACSPYRPGSFQRGATPTTAVVNLGCLDVAADSAPDPVAAWPVLDLRFGNRCDRPVPVDLRRLSVVGQTAGGQQVALVPYDPGQVLRALPLEARTWGTERLHYRDRRDLAPVAADVIAVCVDLAGLDEVVGSRAPLVRCWSRPAMAVASAEATP